MIKETIRETVRKPRYEIPSVRRAGQVLRTVATGDEPLGISELSSPVPLGHRGEECATILSGKARVQVGDEYFDLEEGDTIYFDSGVPHRVLNPGTTPMRLISTITPPSF